MWEGPQSALPALHRVGWRELTFPPTVGQDACLRRHDKQSRSVAAWGLVDKAHTVPQLFSRGMEMPEQKTLDKMQKFVDRFREKTGTSGYPDAKITEILVEGLAGN